MKKNKNKELIITGSFTDIIKASVAGNPKPKPKPKKKATTKNQPSKSK